MEGALVAGAVTKERHGNPVISLELAAQGSANGRGDGRAQNSRLTQDADAEVGQVHGAAFSFAKSSAFAQKLRHRLFHVAPFGDGVAVGAVVAGDPVVVPQGQAGPHGHSFLADVGMGGAHNLPALHHLNHPFFEVADAHHSPQHLHK